MGEVEKTAHGPTLAQQNWGAAIPGGIKPSSGKLNDVAISQMMRQFGIGGQKWIHQFPHSFPIA